MNPFTIIAIVSQAMTLIPKIVEAVQQIMASDQAHTIESAFEQLVKHVTPGQPAAPALGPHASPIVPTLAEQGDQAIDFQAPKG
jgi:hypothetical protein